jgi:hypothetical protein
VSAKSSKFKYKLNKTIPFNHVIILSNKQEPVTCTLVYIFLTLCLLLIFLSRSATVLKLESTQLPVLFSNVNSSKITNQNLN